MILSYTLFNNNEPGIFMPFYFSIDENHKNTLYKVAKVINVEPKSCLDFAIKHSNGTQSGFNEVTVELFSTIKVKNKSLAQKLYGHFLNELKKEGASVLDIKKSQCRFNRLLRR